MIKDYLRRTQLGRTFGALRAELKHEEDTGEACSDGLHCEQRKGPMSDANGDQPHSG
jgi:hypothetical protein